MSVVDDDDDDGGGGDDSAATRPSWSSLEDVPCQFSIKKLFKRKRFN